MSDIVERLRSPEFADVAAKYLMAEAADEIDRLRKERSELLEALHTCVAALENGADDLGAKDKAIAAIRKAKGEA